MAYPGENVCMVDGWKCVVLGLGAGFVGRVVFGSTLEIWFRSAAGDSRSPEGQRLVEDSVHWWRGWKEVKSWSKGGVEGQTVEERYEKEWKDKNGKTSVERTNPY